MPRKRYQETYKYKCSLTSETFQLTKKIKDTEDLISVKAWYDLNPEKDDRPELVKRAALEAEKIIEEEAEESETNE